MPTSYTSPVGDGEMIELRPFIERCAHAFIYSLRDSGLDSPLPTEDTYSSSEYHLESLEKAYKRLAAAKSLDRKQAGTAAKKEHREEVKHDEEYLAKNEATRERYEAMLEQVYTWEPPTKEHEGLKKFMVEQLSESIEFDCGGSYWEEHLANLQKRGPLSGDQWKEQEIERANKDIEYHSEEMAKDKDRAAKNTAWIQALIGSLGGEASASPLRGEAASPE